MGKDLKNANAEEMTNLKEGVVELSDEVLDNVNGGTIISDLEEANSLIVTDSSKTAGSDPLSKAIRKFFKKLFS